MRHALVVVGLLILLPHYMAGGASAQERPSPAAELAFGWVGFADDGIVNETVVGGAARWYLSPRISVGPEVTYIGGDNHSHLVATGNLMFDLVDPAGAGGGRALTPFVVVGGGLFQTRESFVGGDFTSNEGAFTAGGGVRALIGGRITAGIDVRVGWETHVRVNGLIGFRLGRR